MAGSAELGAGVGEMDEISACGATSDDQKENHNADDRPNFLFIFFFLGIVTSSAFSTKSLPSILAIVGTPINCNHELINLR
jgi:hypothetical protein